MPTAVRSSNAAGNLAGRQILLEAFDAWMADSVLGYHAVMTEILEEILAATARLDEKPPVVESLGLYRCWRPQEIRNISMPEASALLVLRGRKELVTESRTWSARRGELLLVPAGTTFWLGNYPDESGQPYRGMAVRFSDDVVASFRQLYGRELGSGGDRDRWNAPAPADFLQGVRQWLGWVGQQDPDPALARHRLMELLLLLARSRLASNLLLSQHPLWSRRVSSLLHHDPARSWRIAEVGRRLGISESTLRRHLQEEGKGFRSLLGEVRLVHGLTLVQESAWSISRIADAVGYRSQSRFSERFKRRFGLTPMALRHTQMPALPVGSGRLAETRDEAAD